MKGRTLQLISAIRDARAPWLRRGSAKAVLYALASFADAEGRCFPSLETLGAAAGLTERATSTIVGELAARGVVDVTRGRQHAPNQYRLRVEALSALRDAQSEPASPMRPALRAEARSGLRTETASPLREAQTGKRRAPEQKKTSSRDEAASVEGAKEGAKEGEIPSAGADGALKLRVVEGGRNQHAELIAHYAAEYARTHGGAKPEIGAGDAKRAKQLRTKYGFDEAKAIVTRWFADEWRAERQPSLRQIDPNAVRAANARPRAGVQPVPMNGSAWRIGTADDAAGGSNP